MQSLRTVGHLGIRADSIISIWVKEILSSDFLPCRLPTVPSKSSIQCVGADFSDLGLQQTGQMSVGLRLESWETKEASSLFSVFTEALSTSERLPSCTFLRGLCCAGLGWSGVDSALAKGAAVQSVD